MKEELLVIFTPSADSDFEMTHIYRKAARQELDWYDNNLHQAYKDITDEMFENNAMKTNREMREEFKERVLSFGTVRKDLQEQFEVFLKAALFKVDEQENSSVLH